MLNDRRWYIFNSKYYWLPAFVFILHQILQYSLEYHIKILDNYLDPLVFIPLSLGAYVQERKMIKGKKDNLSIIEILLLSLSLCYSAEFILPCFNNQLVADYWDIIPYTLGTIYFGLTINKL